VSDDELLNAAHDVALAQYADMLLHQQDQRCAAHTARLQAEGWFDPPSASQAADTVTQHTNADTVLSAHSNPSVSTVVPKEIEAITAITGRPFTLDATVFPNDVKVQ
jgi:hypothetical protein